MIKKKVVNKKRIINKKKKSADINIKVKNVDKIIKANNKSKVHNGGHFWIFGSALAMILSFDRSASILWAILHGIFSWFYVLYRAIEIWGLF